MTARADPFGLSGAPTVDEERTLLSGPPQGWVSLGLLLAMLATVAVAVDDANWAGVGTGDANQTAFLAPGVVLAALTGFLLARSRLPTLLAHVIGASIGTGFLLVSVASAISDAASLGGKLRALTESTSVFYNDLVVLGIRSAETSVFLLTLGALMWTTGQFAAFNLFRRDRAMPAVLVGGLVLLVNMSVTIRVQYIHLIVFAALAMLLLVRMNLHEQRDGWRRRRIGDAGYVSGLFMRGGLTFVSLTLVGAILLAATASSAPLANAWRNLDDQLLSLGTELNRWAGGVTGAARGPSGLFTSSQTIRGVWESSRQVVFTAATSDGEGYYWRGATYDDFDGTTWQQRDRAGARVAPGAELLAVTSDGLPDTRGRREVTVTITSVDLAGGTVLAPEAPRVADRETEVYTNGEAGPFVGVDLVEGVAPGESYTISSLVPVPDAEAGGVTAADLAAAGVDYPAWTRRYVEIRPDSIGQGTYDTADRIVAQLPDDRRDPYHVAVAVQQFLYRTGGFQYSTDVRGLCGRDKVVDCFLRTRRGYCEYFATAMAMLLRTQQIPARMVMGYLPGTKLPDGTFQVDRTAAHAWVEVYFPGYGWIRFDPTPGNQENGQQPTTLDPGDPQPAPSGSAGPRRTPNFDGGPEPLEPEPEDPPTGGQVIPTGPPPADPGPGALIAVALLVAVLGALIVVARLRRVTTTEPDLAYRSVARIATRFGYGPRATQTAYEYAATLGDVVPSVRGELQVVARAKVESQYARRALEGDALEALRMAYARIRLRLLRLAVRRPQRRTKPRPLEPRR
jgi:transglutaminase-like putative cysteine protease